MDPTLSEALKEAYALSPSSPAIIDTLQISHPSLPLGTLSICCNTAPLTCTLEDGSIVTFLPCAFKVTRPQAGDQGINTFPVAIDNVNQVFTDFINLIKNSSSPVTVTYRPYLSNNLTVPQTNPPLRFFMTDITVTDSQVQGTCSLIDTINSPFPKQIYNRVRFPGLANTYAQ